MGWGMDEELTASWCHRIGEAVALKGDRCLRRKEPICAGCLFNQKQGREGRKNKRKIKKV